jgi:copper chaperone
MMEWKVDNIKCGGCAGRIRQQLLSLVGVSDVQVDVEQGVVRVEADADQFPAILARLKRLGYPLTGTTSGLAAVEADVRSVVSCAIGRLHADEK